MAAVLLTLIRCSRQFHRCKSDTHAAHASRGFVQGEFRALWGLLLVVILEISIPMTLAPIIFLLLHGHSSSLLPALLWTGRALCRSVALLRHHASFAVELRFLSQLVLVEDAALVLARVLRVGPLLFLSRGEDGVEDYPRVMHHGRNHKHILPLQPSLRHKMQTKQQSVKYLWKSKFDNDILLLVEPIQFTFTTMLEPIQYYHMNSKQQIRIDGADNDYFFIMTFS